MEVVSRRQLKRSSLFRERRLKKVVSFFRKNRVTLSVAAPGDTNLSDATEENFNLLKLSSFLLIRDIISK